MLDYVIDFPLAAIIPQSGSQISVDKYDFLIFEWRVYPKFYL